MSLDGFVADRERGVEALYRDFAAMHQSDAIAAAAEETGAVLIDRGRGARPHPGLGAAPVPHRQHHQ